MVKELYSDVFFGIITESRCILTKEGSNGGIQSKRYNDFRSRDKTKSERISRRN
jgi:hypothetical protein